MNTFILIVFVILGFGVSSVERLSRIFLKEGCQTSWHDRRAEGCQTCLLPHRQASRGMTLFIEIQHKTGHFYFALTRLSKISGKLKRLSVKMIADFLI